MMLTEKQANEMIARAEAPLNARIEALEAALRELVRLKDIKEALDDADDSRGPHGDEALAMLDDYEANKPKAWAAARDVLSGFSAKDGP